MKKLIGLLLAVSATVCFAGRTYNGTSDKMDAGGGGLLVGLSNATVICAFKVSSLPGTTEVDPCSNGGQEGGGNQGPFIISVGGSGHSNQIGVHWYQSTPLNHQVDVFCSSTVSTNQWYTVVAVFQSGVTGGSGLWVNGASCGGGSPNGLLTKQPAGNPDFCAGGYASAGSTCNVVNFAGTIANFVVYTSSFGDNPTKPSTLAQSLTQVCPAGSGGIMTTPPARMWVMTGSSGGSIEPDLSGNGFNGTLTGTTGTSDFPPCTPGKLKNVGMVGVPLSCFSFPTLCGGVSTSAITYPSVPPTLGGIGSQYTDPTFGSIGILITNGGYDPSALGSSSNTYAASLNGSDDENMWSSDDRLFLVCSTGGTCYLNSFNPSTRALGRPYSTRTSGCPRAPGNCSTYGGWSINSGVPFFSDNDPCRLWVLNGTQLGYYEFGSDVSASNSCSPSISGPPTFTNVFNFIENSPLGCTGTACNCLPSDFGTPTWVGNGSTGGNDAMFSANFASATYNDGSGTSQNHGVYAVTYIPGKGCTSYNTQTNSILADIGFSGGAGFTCGTNQCSATATAPGTYTIHSGKVNQSGTEDFVNVGNTLSGVSAPSDSLVWVPGTNIVYLAENGSHATGHGCFGSLGMWNIPGSPLNVWWYRTTPVVGGASGAAAQVNTAPSPNTAQFDSHCGPQMSGPLDTYPIGFQTTTNSQSTNGCCVLPYDQPTVAWENELDFIANDGSGKVYREMLTYNSGFDIQFSATNTITTCSNDGKFCLFGTNWFNTLGNVGGTSSSCIPTGPAWAASKAYPLNYPIKPIHNNAGGYTFQVTTNGASGLTEPASWPQTVGNTQSDGGVVWTNLGQSTGANACRNDVILGIIY